MATVVTGPQVRALSVGYNKIFEQGKTMAASQYKEIATVVPSTGESETYPWLGEMPGFVEWLGERTINEIARHAYSITNKDWEMTIGVPRNKIADDKAGTYNPMFKEMGRATEVQPDTLVFPALADGVNQLCYDGQNFFDTDHPIYTTHLADKDGATPTVDYTVSNFEDGTDSPWYLLDTSRAINPIILQERQKPVFTAMTDMSDEAVFSQKLFRWGVDLRSNVGYAFWQMARMSKAPLTEYNLDAGIAKMQELKGDGGKPLAINPTILVVRPADRKKALNLVKKFTNGGEDNANENVVRVVISPWII